MQFKFLFMGNSSLFIFCNPYGLSKCFFVSDSLRSLFYESDDIKERKSVLLKSEILYILWEVSTLTKYLAMTNSDKFFLAVPLGKLLSPNLTQVSTVIFLQQLMFFPKAFNFSLCKTCASGKIGFLSSDDDYVYVYSN